MATEIQYAEADVKPAGVEDTNDQIARFIAWAGAQGLTRKMSELDLIAYQQSLAEDMSDLPADLLRQALTATRRTHRFHNLPTSGQIRRHVADDLEQRKFDLHELKAKADPRIAKIHRNSARQEARTWDDLSPEQRAARYAERHNKRGPKVTPELARLLRPHCQPYAKTSFSALGEIVVDFNEGRIEAPDAAAATASAGHEAINGGHRQ